MEEIKRTVKFKNDRIVEPDFYLGAIIKRKELNGCTVWTMSSQEYIKNAVKTVKDQLKKSGKKLPALATTPMSAGYYPETDSSPELNLEDTTLFQELMGILHRASGTDISHIRLPEKESKINPLFQPARANG